MLFTNLDCAVTVEIRWWSSVLCPVELRWVYMSSLWFRVSQWSFAILELTKIFVSVTRIWFRVSQTSFPETNIGFEFFGGNALSCCCLPQLHPPGNLDPLLIPGMLRFDQSRLQTGSLSWIVVYSGDVFVFVLSVSSVENLSLWLGCWGGSVVVDVHLALHLAAVSHVLF